MLIIDFFNRHEHFAYCLQILFFAGMFGLEGRHDTVDVHVVL